MPAMKAAPLHASELSWLLLGVWLAYSAAMLWNMKINAPGVITMCHYVPHR
jgi:hypothetical protein